jgi:hypothetical protein
LTLLVAALVQGAAAGVGNSLAEPRVEQLLVGRQRSDSSVAVEATCFALRPDPAGRSRSHLCRVTLLVRPAAVTPARWARITAALRRQDGLALFRALGLPRQATEAQYFAALRRFGLERPRYEYANVLVLGSGLRLTAARAGTFEDHRRAQTGLRASIPAVEAFAIDHHGYVGLTPDALRTIDSAIPLRLVVLKATAQGYCVTLRVGVAQWYARGPGGRVTTRPCR